LDFVSSSLKIHSILWSGIGRIFRRFLVDIEL
jgi:hypothetical protein